MHPRNTKICLRILLLLSSFLLFYNVEVLISETNTIDRTHDPVVITGSEVPAFLGESVSHIWVYRYLEAQDRWEVIPFQVDELDNSDSYFGSKNGILDVNDEIVFLSKDLGDSTSEISWIDNQPSRSKNRYQIAVSDPLGQGKRGWIYIYCSSTISETVDQYIQYLSGTDQVVTDTYTILHGQTGFQQALYLNKIAGGDSIDFLDRQKFRLTFQFDLPILGTKEIVVKENVEPPRKYDYGIASIYLEVKKKSVETSARRSVRLHRQMILEINITGGSELNEHFEIPFVSTFYPTFVQWKVDSLELNKEEFSSDNMEIRITQIRFSTDLDSHSNGMLFYNIYNPAWVRINGRESVFQHSIQWPGNNWYLIVADPTQSIIKKGSLVNIISIKSPALGYARQLYFKDNAIDIGTDSEDTGDKLSFGDTGIETRGDDISGVVDADMLTYCLPENLNTTQAKQLYNNYLYPLNIASSEEEIQYPLTITVNHPAWGSIEVDPAGTVFNANTSVTITALPNSGYGFLKWEGDIQGNANPKTFTITGPMSVTADFSPKHLIVIQTEPAGLRFIADAKPYYGPSEFYWLESSSHFMCMDRIQYENDVTRYQFQTWNNTHEFCQTYIVPDHQDTLSAQFKTQHSFETSVMPNGAGTIVQTPAGKWLDENSGVILEARPAENYVFSGWSGDLSGNTNPDTLQIDAPKSVTAMFINYDPVISLPDTIFTFNEDDTLTIAFQTFYPWIEDPNHPDSLLIISMFEGNHVGYSINQPEQEILLFTKVPNWNGKDTLTIQVSDPLGAADQDEMIVSVVSRPDFPGPFSLLTPENNTTLPGQPNSIDFFWEGSIDPDAGDTVRYTFQLDTTDQFGSDFLIRKDNISDSFYTLEWPPTYSNNKYYWRVTANDVGGQTTPCRDDFSFQLATAVGDERSIEVPSTFVLEQNRPNPFNGETVIRFGLPISSEVRLIVYNSYGQTVKSLISGQQEQGYHTVRWDGRNDHGRQVSTGLYFIEFCSGQFRFIKKAVLLR